MDRYDDRTPLWDYSDNSSPDTGTGARRWDRARAEEAARDYVAVEQADRGPYGERGRRAPYRPRDERRDTRSPGNYGNIPRREDNGLRDYGEPGGYAADREYRSYERPRDARHASDRGLWPSELGYPPRGYSPYGDYRRAGRADYDDDERGFLDRADDEVLSWFGDRDARRRREIDHRGRGPKNYARSDDRIREDVNDRLTQDVWVDASDIEVSVADGEVTLAGNVEDRAAKRRAEDCAEAVSGVRHVQNNLRYSSGVVSPKMD